MGIQFGKMLLLLWIFSIYCYLLILEYYFDFIMVHIFSEVNKDCCIPIYENLYGDISRKIKILFFYSFSSVRGPLSMSAGFIKNALFLWETFNKLIILWAKRLQNLRYPPIPVSSILRGIYENTNYIPKHQLINLAYIPYKYNKNLWPSLVEHYSCLLMINNNNII